MRVKLLSIVVIVFLCMGCHTDNEYSPLVVFELPDGYLGVFKISESSYGEELPGDSTRFLVDVPPSGNVVLKNV